MDGGPAATKALFGPRGTGGVRLELALLRGDSLEGVEQPFVCLDDGGRYSRVMLARLCEPGGAALRTVALKMQRGRYRTGSGGIGRALTNPEIDEQWRRERDDLRRVRGRHVVELLELGGGEFTSLPVTFCRRTRAFFQPLCATTLAPLRVCRDDDLLRDSGLSAWSSSTARFLHAGPGASGPAERRFYAYSKSADVRPRHGATLRHGSELYRDAAAIVHAELGDDARATVEAAFPCRTCEHRLECYPRDADATARIPAEDLLVPFSYHEFHYLTFELLELGYGELCDLAGGADWADVKEEACRPYAGGRRSTLDGLDEHFATPRQWLFPRADDGRRLLEVLRLKLAAFRQTCEGVRCLHAKAQRPHLDLQPANVMARVLDTGRHVPARWSFDVALIDLGSPRRFVPVDAVDERVPHYLRPDPDAGTNRALVASLHHEADGEEATMRLEVVERSSHGDVVRLAIDAQGPGVRLEDYRPGDRVRVIPARAPEAIFWGTIAEIRNRGLRVDAELCFGERAAAWDVATQVEARVAFFRDYAVPCDVHGLGWLLLRALLVNDTRDMFEVQEKVRTCLDQLQAAVASLEHADDAFCRRALARHVRAHTDTFGCQEILYRAEARRSLSRLVPERLWQDVVAIAFRMLTHVPGFSFCADHADWDRAAPERTITAICAAIDELLARLHVELFGADARDAEIAQVCREMIAELRRPGTTPAPETVGELAKPASKTLDRTLRVDALLTEGRIVELPVQEPRQGGASE